MSRLLCCLRARQADMGAALSHPQEGEPCDGAGVAAAPPTMADVIRERKKKAAGSGLGTLRRRIALVRRPRDNRPDRGCEHARFIRGVVSSWRLAEVFLLGEELEAGAALRDLATQADLAREPAPALHQDLAQAYKDRWWCDIELVGSGWSLPAHRAILAARCTYFRDLLQRYPPGVSLVPLEGAASALPRRDVAASLLALYAGAGAAAGPPCTLCHKNGVADGDLDIINVDGNGSWRCGCGRAEGSLLRRLGAVLGFSPSSLSHDLRYLLESGELADARLVFRLDAGPAASYGFRSALELPCHRVVLAARSRFFRSVMSRRGSSSNGSASVSGSGGSGSGSGSGTFAVCVDEKVLPRRFARALLHAAYTDTVDLSLIGRSSTSPSSTNSTASGTTGWTGVSRNGTRPVTAAMLDDAFQLYEIARFLEMPIVVQGCEDAIVEALSAETLPHVLRWASAPHASHWVHRQAMRYLRDEFPSIMSASGCGRIPMSALADALASPFLQASETQVLRALLRWAADQPTDRRESSVVLCRAQSVGRRGARRREAGDAALRDHLAPLAPLIRLEHLPPDHDLLQQVVRRGIVSAPAGEGSGMADAWLARGSYRPPRCFLPYLDEIKALLEDQAVPEAELSRARRERYLHRIPDTLYMVAAARNGGRSSRTCTEGGTGLGGEGSGSDGCARVCVSPRVLAALRARARHLRAAPPAARALLLHSTDKITVYKQIALRAVREMSLPDACAELLLPDLDTDSDNGCSRERETEEQWEGGSCGSRSNSVNTQPDERWRWRGEHNALDCCRTLGGSGTVRCASAGSLLHIPIDNSRASTCRRELPSRSADTATHRQSVSEAARGQGGRLSAAVPDVAMAPNANTHLLTARDYFRLTPWEYSGGGVLQLDLGDGATHTPRPGSRAQRAGAAQPARQREHAQAMSCLRSRADDDELRAAIELSVIRAYSSFGSRATTSNLPTNNLVGVSNGSGASSASAPPSGNAGAVSWRGAATLPHHSRAIDLQLAPTHVPTGSRSRSSVSPAGAGSSQSAGRHPDLHTPPPHLALSRVGSAERSSSRSPRASPRPRPHDYLYRHAQHDYRLEAYGASSSSSRGHSPNTYA